MSKTKEQGFLKFPLMLAFVLPVLGIIVAVLATALCLKGCLLVFGEEIRSFSELPDLIQALLRILLACIMIVVMKYSSGGTFTFGFRKENLRLSIGLSALALSVAAYNILDCCIDEIPMQSTMVGWFVAILSGIAPGFFEEVICRGIILTNMMERWENKGRYILRSVLLSGIAFGFAHFINLMNGDVIGTVQQVLYAAALGIFFGAAYLRTRNIWGMIIVHSIIDISADIFIDTTSTLSTRSIVSSIVIILVYTLIGLYLIRAEKQESIRQVWEN